MESPQINESFPKRIRSVSARLFSIHNESTTVHAKRTSCHIMASSPEHHSILNPSKWFPRMRCRSSSSASSTFSLVFSSSVNSSFTEPCLPQFSESHHLEHHVSLESVSSELEELYKVAKEEIACATETQGSIYFEGDRLTALTALESCQSKYDSVMQMFKETANAVKFSFRWESDLFHLKVSFDSLPKMNSPIYD
ncbi:hypothetical protein MFLAVUS_006305 [Mucor flavus]|uniref:Uncharacterized protein n=1 Tax=Mucor flavus TaxID=439312 RepID=A0ABP9Z157_9FUNG